MRNGHFDFSEIGEQPEETAPLVKGVLIALIPALLCWAGIISAALKFWHQFFR